MRETEWDPSSRALIAAWKGLTERLCPMCRKPWAIHKAEAEQCRAELGLDATADDLNEAMADLYTAAAIFCPAEAAIDEARADLARTPAEKQAVERGRNPEAPRRWLAFTEADGPPALPD